MEHTDCATEMQRPPAANTAEIRRALDLLFEPGHVVELRAFSSRCTISGYYDDFDNLAKDAAKVNGRVSGVYVTMNRIDADLLARSSNRCIGYAKTTTSDQHVVQRRWFPIDVDPVRPTGISASDPEHDAAVEMARQVHQFLVGELGFPEPVAADSGNGAHLLFRIDLHNDQNASELVQHGLRALHDQFSNEQVEIDVGNYNAGRIWKLYGTVARKGDHTDTRPHRLARLLHAPETLEVVPVEKLRALAATAAQSEKKNPSQHQARGRSAGQYTTDDRFDVAEWIRSNNVPVLYEKPYSGKLGRGRKWILGKCAWNPEHNDKSAFIIQFDDGKVSAGCHHNSCEGKGWPDLRDVVEPGWRDRQPGHHASSRHARLTRLVDVHPERVSWLWPGRIPLGKLTLLVGDPGLGKSFLTLDMAARVSTGASWPDAPDVENPAGSAVLLSAEDDLADTIRPRLDAAGADVSRIGALGISSLKSELHELDRAIEQTPGARLVVVDPISAYLGETDSHRNAEVRGLLAPLSELAAQHRVAVVAVTHLNKNANGVAMYRAMGSLAFTAAARAVWMVAKAKDDETRRLLLPAKNNLAREPSGLAYSVVESTVPGVGRIAWETGPVTVNVDDALLFDRGEPQKRSALLEAIDWLTDALADGPVPAKEIRQRAPEDGIAPRTLDRAKADLEVVAARQGFDAGSKWVWCLRTR